MNNLLEIKLKKAKERTRQFALGIDVDFIEQKRVYDKINPKRAFYGKSPKENGSA